LAVRWLTLPTDIGAFVTTASTTRFDAELFHFGEQPRELSAELRQLAPGSYRALLVIGGEATMLPPIQVARGSCPHVNFKLPSRTLCVLRIEPTP
jgi:hypothetical protein